MDATVDVLNLTAVFPGERPIAQLHIDCRSSAVGGAIEKNLQPALRKLLEFGNRRATVKNLDIPGTIPALCLKPYARWYAPTPLSWISATWCCHNAIELQQQLIASLEIVLKRTNILEELEQRLVIHRYIKYPYI